MIKAHDMIKRHGKEKFVQIAVNCKRNGKTGAEKQRGIKGRIKYRSCQHGKVLIDNWEPKDHCNDCFGEVQTKSKDFIPYFNMGLGGWVESRSDEKRAAKRLGLQEAG